MVWIVVSIYVHEPVQLQLLVTGTECLFIQQGTRLGWTLPRGRAGKREEDGHSWVWVSRVREVEMGSGNLFPIMEHCDGTCYGVAQLCLDLCLQFQCHRFQLWVQPLGYCNIAWGMEIPCPVVVWQQLWTCAKYWATPLACLFSHKLGLCCKYPKESVEVRWHFHCSMYRWARCNALGTINYVNRRITEDMPSVFKYPYWVLATELLYYCLPFSFFFLLKNSADQNTSKLWQTSSLNIQTWK